MLLVKLVKEPVGHCQDACDGPDHHQGAHEKSNTGKEDLK
jgi:hypothetical protein